MTNDFITYERLNSLADKYNIVKEEYPTITTYHAEDDCYDKEMKITISLYDSQIYIDNEIHSNDYMDFIKACIRFSETPLDKRDERKLYYVKLPFTDTDDDYIYLNADFYGDDYWWTSDGFKDSFTEEQIKEIDKRLWAFAIPIADDNQR